uniref:excitatory amino acid transporter 3-like n=1 Tax=Styela clava TaxID=7725 RepID=UPI0019395E04|nr:excitatory amino acid transporter 3-like [Styela clava]
MARCRPRCSKADCKQWTKSNALLLATVAGVVLGVVLGIAMREANLSKLDIKYFSFPGELLLRMLKMIIVPLIICSLITGVATLEGRASGKLGLRTIIYYMGTTLLAVILGIVLVVSINPGRYGRNSVSSGSNDLQVEPVDAILDLIRNAFPENLVEACFSKIKSVRVPIMVDRNVTMIYQINSTAIPGGATTVPVKTNTMVVEKEVVGDYKLIIESKSGVNVLGLIVFCLTFGLIIGKMENEGKILVDFFVAFNEAIMRIVYIIIWYSPVGICFLIASKIMEMDRPEEILTQLGLYMATVIVGLFIHGLIFLPLLYLIFVRKNPITYIVGVSQALLTALATASSSATLPVTIKCLETNNKVDRRVVRLVLPVGATINMDGTALYEAVAAIFIAQSNNIYLNFGQIVVVSITATAASIGAAGVPQAGLVTLLIVMAAVGLPAEDIELILAIDWLLDRFRTTINVLGDSIGAGIIAHLSRDDLKDIDKEDPKVPRKGTDNFGYENEEDTHV